MGARMFEAVGRALRRRNAKQRTRRLGWTAIYVGDYETCPTWAYTIGFHTSLGAPEIVVFDVPITTANGLFHAIYDDLKTGKLSIRDGEPWRPDEVDNPLVWRQVHSSRLYDNDPENPWLALAEDHATILAPERGPISAFQLVLTDAGGHLPWDPQYDETLRPRQRELYLPVPQTGADTAPC